MFEHRKQELLPTGAFIRRLFLHGGIAAALLFVSLGIGMIGYRGFERQSWVDALANSAMLLGGMGPLNPLNTTAGKIFASCYAIYSGVIFLVAVGVFLAPVVHRFLHRFHLDIADELEDRPGGGSAS